MKPIYDPNQRLLCSNTFDKKFGYILSNFDREWNFSRLRNHRKNQFSRFWFFNGEIHFGYFDFVMWFLNFQLVFNFWCWALYYQTFYRMYYSIEGAVWMMLKIQLIDYLNVHLNKIFSTKTCSILSTLIDDL